MEPEAVKAELKKLKASKGKIARQFKSVETGSAEHSALIEQMQQVSADVKALEAQQKKLLKAQNNDDGAKTPKRVLPKQFAPHEESFNRDFSITRTADTANLDPWWDFIAKEPRASAYHSRPVWEFLTSQPHVTAEILIARDASDNIIGGMPLVFMTTPLLGDFAVSMPFFNYGGPVTRFSNVFDALLGVAKEEGEKGSLKYIEVRTLHKSSLSASTKKVSMLRALPDSAEMFDDEIGAKIRAQVKKAEPYRPRFKVGGKELLDDFYDVFSRNMRDLGTPVNSRDFFALLLEKLPEHTYIAMAYVDNQPVATGFLLRHQNMMEVPWASTVREANKMNINMWLYDNMLKFAISKGMHWFDFGRSTQDAGTYRFKKQWGAEPHQHYWYQFSQDPAGESLNPDNPKFKLAIGVWQRLPVWVTRKIGPFVSSQLP